MIPAGDRTLDPHREGHVNEASAGPAATALPASVLPLPTRAGVRAGPRRLLLARRGDRWDAVRVADHLMSCRRQMVNGLRYKSPWAGLDLDTLESCFGAGAALVVDLASTGKRPDWRTAEDLEKALIAAYRNQVRDHWKHVNAQARTGDRLAIVFDPERHAAPDAQLERLFSQPDLFETRRDLLAEMGDPALRAFWTVLFEERLTFKAAGDRLNLTKAQVLARVRAGRTVLNAFIERRDSGDLCVERGLDVAAVRAGNADDVVRERADAHLESCYPCSLVHARRTSAFGRGMLALTPTGLLLRLSMRVGEMANGPATRWADAGAGARAAAGGLAAVALAGSAVGLEAATEPARPVVRPAASAPVARATSFVPTPVREAFRTPGLLVTAPPAAASASTSAPTRGAAPGLSGKPGQSERSRETRATPTAAAATPQPPPAVPVAPEPEFSFEQGRQAAPSPTTSSTPAAPEFAVP